jgi:hypothetical protein
MRQLRGVPALVTIGALLFSGDAIAATISVDTTSDVLAADSHCSLREAVKSANNNAAPFPGTAGECGAGSGPDAITVPPGTYKLNAGFGPDAGDLDLSSLVTITGAGREATIIDADHVDRAIDVSDTGTVTLSSLTVTNGRTTDGGNGPNVSAPTPGGNATGGTGIPGEPGGGIRNLGTLTVVDATISNNTTGSGGRGGNGTGAAGTTAPSGTSGGSGTGGTGGTGGDGGGIFTAGPLTLTRVLVTGNVTGAGGPGGTGFGGQGGAATANGAFGGQGGSVFGGHGGRGGGGGGVGASAGAGLVAIDQTTIAGNTSGTGGNGGVGNGGDGGLAGGIGGTGGQGGGVVGGFSGFGGPGGGVYVPGTAVIAATLVQANTAGPGGRAGNANGGDGGDIVNSGNSGGQGGTAVGGPARGSMGGGLATGSATYTNVTITGNLTSPGSAGGNATGGKGGNVAGSGFAGHGGDAAGGEAGAGGWAGGLYASASTTMTHSTTTENQLGAVGLPGTATAGLSGSGGTPNTPGTATAGNSGLNPFAGAILTDVPITVANSILAGNGQPSCSSLVTDAGHNVTFPDSTCPGIQVDPLLAPLAENFGPTRTQALAAGSPAIDAVPASGSGCSPFDQRGVQRPQGGGCDAGAYERALAAVSVSDATDINQTGAALHGSITPNASSASYHFDYGPTADYGAATAETPAAGGTTAVAVAETIAGLASSTTYHFRLVATTATGTSASEDRTFTTAAAEGGPAPAPGAGASGADTLRPRFLSAKLAPKVFAVNRRGKAERLVKSRAKKGTTITFKLSEAARVVFAVQRVLPKKRFGKALRFAMNAKAGANKKKFSGRIGKKALKPGRYRLTMVARDGAGNRSTPKRLTFSIVRR